jgi:signal transduction histidine kinase
MVTCQPARLTQVFINLFKNSIDAFDSGGGTVTIVTSRPKGSKGRHEGVISIIVSDDGEGIPAESIKKVMDLGFSTRPGNGRGNGLHIAKSIIEEHGGSIAIESPVIHTGQGTTIRIQLQSATA